MVLFAYAGYPITLKVVSIFRKNEVHKKSSYFPTVALIITVFNEEKRIRQKLENTLALDYPKENLQVLIASDGSTDKTHEIVKGYENEFLKLFIVEDRKGKENAQKEAVQYASGEIIVFSDVATILEPDGLKQIVSNFADPTVGCVSSVDKMIGKDGRPSGEGAYVKYEMWLRNIESKVNSLVGLSGSFFAARKEVCKDFAPDMQSDFRTLINSIKLGLRGVSDPDSIGYYHDVADDKKEFTRKVRTVLRGMTVFFHHIELLDVLKYGIFSYQIFCHKLLRWCIPFFLTITFITNLLLLSDSLIWEMLFFCQLLFYSAALWGWIFNPGTGKVYIKIPMYFTVVNISILVAWWKYITGKRQVMWTPSIR